MIRRTGPVTQATDAGYLPADALRPRGYSERIRHLATRLHRRGRARRAQGRRRTDVALLVSATSCATAGVFTKNALRAAPVVYDARPAGERPGRCARRGEERARRKRITGGPGLAAARAMAQAAEQAAGLRRAPHSCWSTGVIAYRSPSSRSRMGLRAAAGRLDADGGRRRPAPS